MFLKMKSDHIIITLCVIISSFYLIRCENSVTVETKLGSVKGTVIAFNEYKLNEFQGIPYAEPPIGSNRFGKPKPITKWNQTIDATHAKNICWQSSTATQKYNQSEDCLVLNIWSQNKTDTKLHPVMFWIHGGGFHDGHGYWNGQSLTTFGVVVVSINYRVGPFGFLYGDDPSAPGNVGIYDQIMALKWVNENIDRFGGDPKQITIFGQSAGSWSVSALIVSPLSRNLFKRAIMQSGAYFFRNYRNYNSTYHLNAARKMSESIGCPNDNQWLDCLRKAEPKTIVEHNSLNPSLVFDNEILPHKIEDALKLGEYQKGINFLL